MTLLWTEPRDWVANDPITKEKLNDISNDLRYLLNPSRQIVTVRGTGSNVTNASVTFVDLDAATYGVSVELTGARDVDVSLQGLLSNNTLATINVIDFLIDSTTYLSSLTNTALTQGCWEQQQPVASQVMRVSINLIIPAGVLSAGVHTFVPRWRVSAGTATWYEATNLFSQFSVGE